MPKLAVTLDKKKLAKIQDKLGPDLVLPPVGRLLADLTMTAQHEASANAPRSTGALAQSILVESKPLEGRVFTSLRYAKTMEGGRKPLAAGGKFPPIAPFLARAGSAGAAFAIARSVARRGIRGRFFFRKARTAANRALPRLAEGAAQEIASTWAEI